MFATQRDRDDRAMVRVDRAVMIVRCGGWIAR